MLAEVGDSILVQKRRDVPNVYLMLGQRLRCWPNIKHTLGERLVVFPGGALT